MTEPDPNIASVRLLTGLSTTELPDTDIASWLNLNDQVPRRAAADALEAFASTLVDFDSDDASITGSARARTLLQRAASLREQAETDDFTFDVVFPHHYGPELTERECW